MTLSPIGLADLIRAWHNLQCGETDQIKVANLLGFRMVSSTEVQRPTDDSVDVSANTSPSNSKVRARSQTVPTTSENPIDADMASIATIERDVESFNRGQKYRPRLSASQRGPRTRELTQGHEKSRLAVSGPGWVQQHITRDDALFESRLAPSLLATLLATDAADGPVDTEALVSHISTRSLPGTLPRRSRPSLYRGVQVLIDIGRAMLPFRYDCQILSNCVLATVGRSNVQARLFSECPIRGAGEGPRWTWSRYKPPSVGTPVLVLTDAGIGGPTEHHARSQEDEWIELADLLRKRRSRLILLVPYPKKRWPPRLTERLSIVTWDRNTSLMVTYRLVGVLDD